MKQFFFACAAFLFVFLTGSGCKKASVTQQPALPVNVVTVVEKEVNEWDEFTGRLDPVESVEIRPRVSGYITEIHFEAGATVRFAYEWHDDSGHWYRSYGNENWEFNDDGLMALQFASINDLPILESDRKYHWPLGRRPDDHPGLSDLGL